MSLLSLNFYFELLSIFLDKTFLRLSIKLCAFEILYTMYLTLCSLDLSKILVTNITPNGP